MLYLLIGAAGLVVGGVLGVFLFTRLQVATVEDYDRPDVVVDQQLLACLPDKRFKVIIASDLGAVARRAYEDARQERDAIVVFLDGASCRGTKEARA